jgi:hypothetical protein
MGVAAGIVFLGCLLWAAIWSCVRYGSRLPKFSWKRLPVAILGLGALSIVISFQISLLRGLKPGKALGNVLLYVVMYDCLPAIALTLIEVFRAE